MTTSFLHGCRENPLEKSPRASPGWPTHTGKAIVNLLNLGSEEKVTAILPLKDFAKDKFITFMTKGG